MRRKDTQKIDSMLKHTPSGTAVNQQQQQQQHQTKNLQNQQATSVHQISHNHNLHVNHVHPKNPPPPPPQIHRPNVILAANPSRAILNRSIPLNVSTLSHTLPSIVLTPTNKLIPNGHANGGFRPNITNTNLNITPTTTCSSQQNHCNLQLNVKHRIGAREALTSLGLLCLG